MEGYDTATYGDRIASIYDEWYLGRMDPGPAVELLAELAGEGRALELGVGTGRIAIPLAGRGIRVTGIDASQAMVDRLASKPGGERVEVVRGDFTDVAVSGSFSLVYIPFTTLFALPSQDDQLRCLRNVASHLDAGGHFVMDAFVPDVARFRNHQDLSVQDVGTDQVVVDASRHDPVAQRIESSHVVFTEAGVRLYPVVVRYAWPAELDAMALAAGMRLKWRFADYHRHTFDAASTRHVSVYERRDAWPQRGAAPKP
jgi:SAM-dependent methyltransferase